MNDEPKTPLRTGQGMDYGEQADVQQVHAAVQREKREPRVGAEPLSIWLIAIYGLAIFFGGAYSAVTREISSAADSIRWVRRPRRRKQWQEDLAAASKLNFRRAIEARRFLRPIVRPVIRLTALAWPANIHRLLVQNLRSAARAGRR